MNKLVIGNILYRPVRSAISVLAVAIEVIMILSIVAIMVGQIQGAANQTNGIGADIMVRPPNASNFSGLSDAAVPAKIAPEFLAKLPHVAVASPTIAKLDTSGAVQTIFGIDYPTYMPSSTIFMSAATTLVSVRRLRFSITPSGSAASWSTAKAAISSCPSTRSVR